MAGAPPVNWFQQNAPPAGMMTPAVQPFMAPPPNATMPAPGDNKQFPPGWQAPKPVPPGWTAPNTGWIGANTPIALNQLTQLAKPDPGPVPPGGQLGGLLTMRAPDGTIGQVAREHLDHYVGKGAVLV